MDANIAPDSYGLCLVELSTLPFDMLGSMKSAVKGTALLKIGFGPAALTLRVMHSYQAPPSGEGNKRTTKTGVYLVDEKEGREISSSPEELYAKMEGLGPALWEMDGDDLPPLFSNVRVVFPHYELFSGKEAERILVKSAEFSIAAWPSEELDDLMQELENLTSFDVALTEYRKKVTDAWMDYKKML